MRPLQKSFFDVRVTHPNCPSHVIEPQKTILKQNATIKKTQYNERVREIENASFKPLVFSTNGATGEEATPFHKVLAEKIERKDKIFIRRGNHVHSKTDFFYDYTYSTYCFERKKEKCPENHANK